MIGCNCVDNTSFCGVPQRHPAMARECGEELADEILILEAMSFPAASFKIAPAANNVRAGGMYFEVCMDGHDI